MVFSGFLEGNPQSSVSLDLNAQTYSFLALLHKGGSKAEQEQSVTA